MLNEDPAVAMWRETLDAAIHAAAEKHLEDCYEALYASEEDAHVQDDPAFAPFCGCTTCVVREVLTAAWFLVRYGETTPDLIREALQREFDR